MDTLDLDEFTVVCMVDTQPGTGNNSWPAELPVHVVIDHHPLRGSCQGCRWVDVREDYGASATILFEYLLSQDVYLSTRLATILLYAIKSDTLFFSRQTNRVDLEAFSYLYPLADAALTSLQAVDTATSIVGFGPSSSSDAKSTA